MIPTEMFEGRVDPDGLRILVQSAADANFNMLRVWGGGIYQYQAFYDACDDFGIMLFHDAQYAQEAHRCVCVCVCGGGGVYARLLACLETMRNSPQLLPQLPW
jgi:beta-galactosidase/beta-glucuronidase